MSNSNLVDYTRLSPFCNSPRNKAIKKITIHHMAGNLTVETCGSVFQSSNSSSNYGVGTDGRVGLYVNESDRSWASSSGANDHQAITIEVANDGGAPDWHVSDTALAKTIELCVDICKRNGIKKLTFTGDASGNLTMHRYFAATTCPGPYLASKFPYIAAEVNKRLGAEADEIDVAVFNCPVLRYGSRGDCVVDLQTKLTALGFDTRGIDGQYGDNTRKAVKEYQKARGLSADGVVGALTWGKLNAEKPDKEKETGKDEPQTYTVVKGDTLSSIARKYGTTYKNIAELNGLKEPFLIYPGNILKIK